MSRDNDLKDTACAAFNIPKKYFWTVIIIGILMFIVQVYVSYDITHKLDDLQRRPGVAGFIAPYIQHSPSGDYLPVILLNTGDLTLYNVTVGILSCVMMNNNDSYEIHTIPIILPHNQYTIPFANKATIDDFESLWCTPSSDYPYPSITFSPYLNSTVETVTKTCGYCKYRLIIESDKINQSFEDYYRDPVDLTLKVIPAR